MFQQKVSCNFRLSLQKWVAVLSVVLPSLLWCTTVNADVVVLFQDGSKVQVDEISIHTERSEAVLKLTRGNISLTRTVPLANVKQVRDFHKTLYTSSRVTNPNNVGSRTLTRKQPYCETQKTKSVFHNKSEASNRAPIGKVIGIRNDPLDTYRQPLDKIFPNGIPLSERGFARELMRRQLIHKIYESSYEGKNQQEQIPETGAVRTLHALARPVNFNGKADWDSLEIQLGGKNQRGAAVPLKNGTLRVTLWGLNQNLVRSHGNRFTGIPGKPIPLASWTRQLSNFSQNQTIILPLPHPLPEHDPGVFAIGDVHVQLLVPGVGVLESSIANIPLRREGLIRDRQLAETGSRFFPTETTVGSKRLIGTAHYNLSSLTSSRFMFQAE